MPPIEPVVLWPSATDVAAKKRRNPKRAKKDPKRIIEASMFWQESLRGRYHRLSKRVNATKVVHDRKRAAADGK
jgi:hypothetical protein